MYPLDISIDVSIDISMEISMNTFVIFRVKCCSYIH